MNGRAYKAAVRNLAFWDASEGLVVSPTECQVEAAYRFFKGLLCRGEFGGDPEEALAGLAGMVGRRLGLGLGLAERTIGLDK